MTAPSCRFRLRHAALAGLISLVAACASDGVMEPEPAPVTLLHQGHFDLTRLGDTINQTAVGGHEDRIELIGHIVVPDLCHTFTGQAVEHRDTVTVTVQAQRNVRHGHCPIAPSGVPYWIYVDPTALRSYVVRVAHTRVDMNGREEARREFEPVTVRLPSLR